MPAVAAITLADAAATPVSHTFNPLGPDVNGVWWFEERLAASTIGNQRISVQLIRPGAPASGQNSSQRICRVKIGIHTPVLETLSNSTISGITAAPTVAYVDRCNMEFIIPERSVLQDRQTIRKYADNLLANANITTVIESLENYY